MDELPELMVEAVGEETVVETIALGGGDAVAVATTETHLYRSEGLLSEESVETFDHDVERLSVDEGRRKSAVRLAALDEEREFTVPSSVVDDVVVAVLEGVLRTIGVVDDEESVLDTFRFSELTLVVTDERLCKHVGSAVWDDDHEAFAYSDLTRLVFEEGSVATQVVLQADGRQQRVKVPNDRAGRVREEIQSAVFEYHDVSSLGELHAAIDPDAEPVGDDATPGEDDAAADVEVDANAVVEDPHAADGDPPDRAGAVGAPGTGGDDRDDGFVSADWSPPADQDVTGPGETATDDEGAGVGGTTAGDAPTASGLVGGTPDGTAADVEALAERVDHLGERIDRQNELLESQRETIEQLVAELRRGR